MEKPTQSQSETLDPLAEIILHLVRQRGPDKSICPSEAARAFAEGRARKSDPPDLWRRYMTGVRQQALFLARQGHISILRKGKPVDPFVPVKGLIRLSLPRSEPETAPSTAPEIADKEDEGGQS